MGHFVSIRGWLELNDGMVPLVREIINDIAKTTALSKMPIDVAEFYNRGWVFPSDKINWTSYVFYGANIRLDHLEYLKTQLKLIAERVKRKDDIFIELFKDSVSDEKNLLDYPTGLFYVDYEDREIFLRWEISKGEFIEFMRQSPEIDSKG